MLILSLHSADNLVSLQKAFPHFCCCLSNPRKDVDGRKQNQLKQIYLTRNFFPESFALILWITHLAAETNSEECLEKAENQVNKKNPKIYLGSCIAFKNTNPIKRKYFHQEWITNSILQNSICAISLRDTFLLL